MKKETQKTTLQKMCKLLALVLVVGIFGIFCWLAPTKAEAISATAVTLTATDGTQTTLSFDADVSAPTYSWDAETATLTLKGYSGRSITTNGDINLHLVGDNTLTLDSNLTGSGAFGLNLNNCNGVATVTADEGGTLNIVGNIKTYFSAVAGGVIFKSGTLNIDVTTSGGGTLYAFERNVSFDREGTGQVEINVNIERTSDANSFIYGFYNGMNISSRENVTINVDLKGSENDTVIGFDNLYVENSAPKISVSVDNKGGYFKLRKAVRSITSLSLTEGGRVEANGLVGMSSIGGDTNANTVTTTPQNNNYIWMEYDTSTMYSGDYLLCTLDGDICEETVFEYSDTPAELKWVGDGLISIPEGKVDDNFSVNLLAAIRGLSGYDAYYLRCNVIEGQLPEGLYIAYSGGLLNGQISSPCEAGSVRIRLTDQNKTPYDYSDDRTVEFTLNYGAIADRDRFVTVGTSDPVEMKTDGSGEGWSYDGETKTLTLNGYNGGPIVTEGVLNIHLKGNNTITLTDDNTVGIESTYSSGEINLTADADGVLNINTPDNYTKSFTGIYASMYVSGGTVNMSLASDFTGDWSFIGMAQRGYLSFLGDGEKSWNVSLKNNNTSENKVRLYGNYNNNLCVEECSNVEINIDIRGGKSTEIHGIYALTVYKTSPVITVYADNQDGNYDCMAIDGISNLVFAEGGRLDVTGNVYTGYLASQQSPNTVTTTPANNGYYWKDLDDHSYYEDLWMADLDGNLLDRVVFEYSAEPSELKWVGGTHFDIPTGAVGDYVGFDLWAGLRGVSSYTQGNPYWKFEIIEGHLPSGIDFSAYPVYNGKISEQIVAPCTAGTATIRATDMMGTYDTADDRVVEFTINYGAFSTNNPVSGVEISKDTLVLDYNGTGEITATVTPSDAAYPYVETIIIGDNHLIVNVGEPVNGVSVITVQAYGYPGTYTVQIRTVELGITKTLTVHVKEDAPNTYINYFEERVYGFAQGESYKISGDGISTLQFVAESNFVNIPTEWFGKTLNIVKVNGGNGDCDSEAQILQIPARPAAPTGIETTDASSYESNGKISGLASGMQYKPSDADNWYYYWSPEVSVEVGSHDIRYAATNHSFAGEKITVNIGYEMLAFEDRESFDIPAGYSNTVFSFYIYPAVSGGKEPYVYSIDGPAWITIDQEGLVSVSRPDSDQAATTATITVTDGDDNSKSITILVGAVTVPHVCVFDQQVATSDYRKSGADCLNKAVYYYSCECGALGNVTFEYGEALGHNYVEKIVDNEHLKQKAEDCQHFDEYWYECTRCDSISDENFYSTQERGDHKYPSSFNYKVSGGHAHVCTVYGCGAMDELIPHTPGAEATEDNPQICTVCSFVINPALNHVHNPSDEWNGNQTHHWHDCLGEDGYHFDEEEHTYDTVCDKDCNVCGAIRVPTSHVEEAVWVNDADSHYSIHNCCGTIAVAEEAHNWNNGICSDCEYTCLHPADNDRNHKCDVCDGAVGVHEAAEGTHLCDYCGERFSYCTDEDLDHKCDVCEENVGTHDTAAGSHICGYCGEAISECSDADENGKCDICGATLSTPNPDPEPTPEPTPDPETPATPEAPAAPAEPKTGLGAGAIVAIVVGSVLVVGVGGFSVFWLVIKKKSFADLVSVFNKGKGELPETPDETPDNDSTEE